MYFLLLSVLVLFRHVSSVVAQLTCPRGTFRSLPSLQCVSCPPGTFQPALNASFCVECPSGRFQPFPAAQTSEACRPCRPGTFSTSASAACFSCPSGLSSGPASSTCITCQPGTFLSRENATSFQTPCRPCTGGFTVTPNQLSCTACPEGFVAPVAASSADQCTVACPPGTQSSANGCEPCPPNTFSADGKQCRTCFPGTVSNGTGATACTPCEPGEYAVLATNSEINSRCASCPPGTVTFSSGALICRQRGNPCPRGYLQLSSGDCIRCPLDHFYDSASEQCVPCRDGEGSAGGLSLSCAPCSRIVEARIVNSRCFSDAPGVVVIGGDGAVCPPGTKRDEELGVCIACDQGMFSAAGECETCPAGSVQPNMMATSCIFCENGTVPDDDRIKCVNPLTNCPSDTDLVTATNVPAGTVSSRFQCRSRDCDTPPFTALSAISRTCGKCKRSDFLNADMSCSPCGPNSISDGRFCVPCPRGLVRDGDTCACRGILAQNKGLVNGICQECAPGSYGFGINALAEHSCVQCPAGTFRDVANDVNIASCDPSSNEDCPEPLPCKKCPPNSVTRAPGATQCQPCPQGTFSYGLGETECLREGAGSEPVSFTGPFGAIIEEEDPEETSTQPLPVLDEIDDILTSAEPEESQVPEIDLPTTDEAIAFSDEPVSSTGERPLESSALFLE